MVVKYYLTNPEKESKLRMVCINSRKEQFKFTTAYSIQPKYWDGKRQYAKKSMQGSGELNQLLEQLKLDVLKLIRELKINGITEWSVLKTRLKNYLKTGSSILDSEVESGMDLSIGIVVMIDDFLRAKVAEYKPETVKKYRVLQAVLQAYESHSKSQINLSNLSYSMMEEFRLYLLNVRHNRNDTIYKMLAALKCVIRWLIDNKYDIDPNCLKLRQSTKNKHDIVTLNENELQMLQAAIVTSFQEPIRDCFLFQVYTGQRFSDMQQLKPEQINDKTWQFQSVKTGKIMHIPLVGWCNKAYRIANKYHFKFPQYTQQYFNREVTKICRQAGITALVTLNRYIGSKTIHITKPKCELVSSHTARRTCVSLLLEKGVPPTVVMRLTGHSRIQTMMRYERTSNEVLHNALLKL